MPSSPLIGQNAVWCLAGRTWLLIPPCQVGTFVAVINALPLLHEYHCNVCVQTIQHLIITSSSKINKSIIIGAGPVNLNSLYCIMFILVNCRYISVNVFNHEVCAVHRWYGSGKLRENTKCLCYKMKSIWYIVIGNSLTHKYINIVLALKIPISIWLYYLLHWLGHISLLARLGIVWKNLVPSSKWYFH